MVCHCLLNPHSRVEGLARCPGAHPVVSALNERDFGVIQLPCPELAVDGLDRPPRAIEDYDTVEYRAMCSELAEEISRSVALYERKGVRVVALMGVEGSPSCGVSITNTKVGAEGTGAISVRGPGSGVFIQELRDRLEPHGVRFAGVDAHEADMGVSSAMSALGPDG